MKDPRSRSEKKRKRKAIPAAENQPLLPAVAEDIGSIGGTDTSNRKVKTVDGKHSKKSKRRKNEEICSVMAAAKAGVSSISTQRLELPLSCTSKVAEFEHSSRSSNWASAKGIVKKKGAYKKRRREKQPSSLRLEGKNDRSCSVYDASLSRNPGGDKVDDDDSIVGGDDDDDISLAETLEGIVYEELMYLVDSQRNVFSAERNARGEPVRVGVLDEQGRVVLQVSQSNDADAPANTIEISTSKDVVKRTQRKPKKKKKKKKRSVGTEETVAAAAATATANGADDGETGARGTIGSSLSPREKPVEIVEYPFEVEECDHCETSERAYADIAPLLKALAGKLGKVPEELSIYDPYYCQGSTVGRLAALGFSRVYNRKEDFYEVIEKDEVPAHDVVVTNPPFSGDHVAKILRFCSRRGAKPWFLLLPNFVYLKDYYEPSLTSGSRGRPALPFFLTPPKRYMFYSPQGSRLNIKSSERKTSPFNTFWYIRLGDPPITSKMLMSFEATSRQSESYERCCIARTPSQIPFKMMDSNDPLRKKARDKQRSIERMRKKKSAWADA